jgi:hypothetical protein
MRKKRFDAANVKVHGLILLSNKGLDLYLGTFVVFL